jgi:hypothetical protein
MLAVEVVLELVAPVMVLVVQELVVLEGYKLAMDLVHRQPIEVQAVVVLVELVAQAVLEVQE